MNLCVSTAACAGPLQEAWTVLFLGTLIYSLGAIQNHIDKSGSSQQPVVNDFAPNYGRLPKPIKPFLGVEEMARHITMVPDPPNLVATPGRWIGSSFSAFVQSCSKHKAVADTPGVPKTPPIIHKNPQKELFLRLFRWTPNQPPEWWQGLKQHVDLLAPLAGSVKFACLFDCVFGVLGPVKSHSIEHASQCLDGHTLAAPQQHGCLHALLQGLLLSRQPNFCHGRLP